MPIKFTQHGNLWTAEVTPPHGQWRSPHPMESMDLTAALKAIGCDKKAIDEAFFDEFFEQYRPWAEEAIPQVEAALAGDWDVPSQTAFTEAWLTYALYEGDKKLTV